MTLSLRNRFLPLVLCLSTAPVLAQSGSLDQNSPATNAGFNWDANFLIWQQQVRVGIAGQLEGVEVYFLGPVGGHFDFRIRIGDGWNTGPVVFSSGTNCTLNFTSESFFFDITSANLTFAVGDTFVWEVQGNDTGVNGLGSYVPPPGTPLYPENLYLGGPGCYSDCGWRLAFTSYMLPGGSPVTSVCFGDGSGTPCPCANNGTPASGGGCANGAPMPAGQGAVLTATGSNSIAADNLVLTANFTTNQPGLFFQGDVTINGGNGAAFGDGLRCCGTNVIRLEIVDPPGPNGSSTAQTTQAIIATSPPGTIQPGVKQCYQWWYRNPNRSICGANFNLSNAVSVIWVP